MAASQLDLWFQSRMQAEVQELCPTNESVNLSKWGNVRFFPLEFELLLCTCALLSCGPFTAAAMKTFILQQVKWCPLNSFCGSTIFSFTGPKAAGWCLIIYSLHPLSSRASGITFNVRRKALISQFEAQIFEGLGLFFGFFFLLWWGVVFLLFFFFWWEGNFFLSSFFFVFCSGTALTSVYVNANPLFLVFLTQSSQESFLHWKDCEGVL